MKSDSDPPLILSQKSRPLSEEELDFKRKNFPNKPGCYIFKDNKGTTIYVGKAKALNKRINSYWKENRSEDPYYSQKKRRMVKSIKDIEVFIVGNELEALILENELIKQNQPYYNVALKDDKSYPFVRITNEEFPRISVIRGPNRWGLQHKYLGPFVAGFDLKKLIKFARKIFPYCTCKRCNTAQKRVRPCINYQIGLCPAPCMGYITKDEYMQNIDGVEKMVRGEIDEIRNILDERMQKAAKNLAYEEAATWRDRIKMLEMFTSDQAVMDYDTIRGENTEEGSELALKNLDVIAGHISEDYAGILILHIRKGRVISKTPYIFNLEKKLIKKSNYYLTFVKQHYLQPEIPLPDEIVIDNKFPPETEEAILGYLLEKKNANLAEPTDEAKNIVPTKFSGPNEENKTSGYMRIAKSNIKLLLKQQEEYDKYMENKTELSEIEQGLEILQEVLELQEIPSVIEAFDMSHDQGKQYVGSKVCFVDGQPNKKQYRHYKVRTVDKPDDIKSMQEVMGRRYKRVAEEKDLPPDLIVVDGGKAQLNMANNLLKQLGLESIPHIGISKPEGRSEISKAPKLLLPDREEPIILALDSPALHIIQHLRNESHRFAIKYHRNLKTKQQKTSELDQIPGVGKIRKRKLLQFYGSVDEIRKLSADDMTDLIGPALAQTIFQYFQDHPKKGKRKKKLVKAKVLKKKTNLKK